MSAGTVRRLACDAGIIPMVLGTNSEPLDVGTEHRFVTPAIRQALNTRDKGCVICQPHPPCAKPTTSVHWADGGPTTITNLALLCKPHHIDVHQGHRTLTFHNGHPHHTHPPWSTKPQTKDPPTAVA